MKHKRQFLWLTILSTVLFTAFMVGCKKDKNKPIDGVCPVVVKTDPTNLSVAVPLDKVITATFNEKMNSSTIDAATFSISDGNSNIAGTIAYDPATFTASFTPSAKLVAGTTYTGKITPGVKDMMGLSLQTDYVWSFSTSAIISPVVLSTDPKDKDTNVVINKTISADFNIPLDPLSVNAASFTLKQGSAAISGTVTYNGLTASFKPAANLISNTVYTAAISTAVKSLSGNPMLANYTWTFTTGSFIAPVVISTDPVANATSVVLNKIVRASFNMPMNASTINNITFTLTQGSNVISGVVSYTGTTASFTPSASLTSGSTYTATITNGVQSAGGIAMGNNYSWSFSTGAIIAPVVISTDPVNNATGVPLLKTITATFSMGMDPASLNSSTFILKQGGSSISGTVSYSGTTAYFVPASSLLPGTVYTATITSGAMSVSSVPLANSYTWTFTTVVIPAPVVVSTDPPNNATGIVLNKVITATFNVPMNPATINTSTFTVYQGSTQVSGTVSYSGTTASFTPSVNLSANKTYTATITTGAKSLAGVALASNYVWNFTTVNITAPTVISTDPANNTSGVPLNKVITATFSVPMDPATMNSSTFTIKNGTNAVSGSISYSGSVATFTPSSNLSGNTVYTGTITTGAKNVGGTPLASDYVWSFTTLAATPPTVISTNPANNATGVVLTKVITATFSVPMDPATISTSTFTLKHGATTVSGAVMYSGSTASFTPSVNLLSNTVYTATITTGAKNVAGTPLASNYVWSFTTVPTLGPDAPNLNSAANFGILAGVGISNNAGFSVINNMDVGISPGARSSITGFPPAVIVNGSMYASDDGSAVAAMLIQAKADLTAAYLYAEGASSPAPATVSGDQGGKTLAPGIYKSTSTLSIQNGDLTLDAQGDANAVWIFQVASAFTTIGGAGGNIILTGGAQAKNIYWQVGSSATIGDYTSFKGNILALSSITMGAYSTATGRMLARNASVVMTSTNIINKP
jgi:hypothetical protein